MSSSSVSLTKRHKTATPGIYFRVKAAGGRTYQVNAGGGRYISARTEKEALTIQADLRLKRGRGQKVPVNDRTKFSELAEEWYALKSKRLRRRTADYYRRTLDVVLLPRFGNWRVSALDVEAVAELVRDLEERGLNAVDRRRPKRPLGRSSVDNYLKPLHGVMKLAVRRNLVAANPVDLLTEDDRPAPSQRVPHEWTSEELERLYAASSALARRPESRYDYTPLLRLTARLGLRLGEVLGLQWRDFDSGEKTLSVARQWTRYGEYGDPKTEAGKRTIYLPEDVAGFLDLLRQGSNFSADEDPIFASREGTPLTHRNVTSRGWEPARAAARLEDACFHDLRHAAFSRLHGKLDEAVIADQLGHANVATLRKTYTHVYDRGAKAAAVRAAL